MLAGWQLLGDEVTETAWQQRAVWTRRDDCVCCCICARQHTEVDKASAAGGVGRPQHVREEAKMCLLLLVLVVGTHTGVSLSAASDLLLLPVWIERPVHLPTLLLLPLQVRC